MLIKCTKIKNKYITMEKITRYNIIKTDAH